MACTDLSPLKNIGRRTLRWPLGIFEPPSATPAIVSARRASANLSTPRKHEESGGHSNMHAQLLQVVQITSFHAASLGK